MVPHLFFSPLWWLCQLLSSCFTGTFSQILLCLPLFSLCYNVLLVPVFNFWWIGLVYRNHKNMTWAVQGLHLRWMMTWDKAALACHTAFVLMRSLLVWLCQGLVLCRAQVQWQWSEVANYFCLMNGVFFIGRRNPARYHLPQALFPWFFSAFPLPLSWKCSINTAVW